MKIYMEKTFSSNKFLDSKDMDDIQLRKDKLKAIKKYFSCD